MNYLILAGFVGGTGGLLWAGIHFGSRWIDKMLCVPPPTDPNKPLVRRWDEGEHEGCGIDSQRAFNKWKLTNGEHS